MKATELRIGNLVNGVLTQKPYIIDAWALREMESGNYQNSQDTETKVFEPIPLTEEWMLKFGFEEIQNAYTFGDYQIVDIHNGNTWLLEEFDYENICFVGIGKGMNYVHQLQNLYFALTGQELTFKSE